MHEWNKVLSEASELPTPTRVYFTNHDSFLQLQKNGGAVTEFTYCLLVDVSSGEEDYSAFQTGEHIARKYWDEWKAANLPNGKEN